MFYYNKMDITPPILNGGNEIIFANWPNDKYIICTINNDILIEIPSHPYVLVNRSVLCNCGIEVENNFLLESLATCHDANTSLIMYFMVNTAFTNYLCDRLKILDMELTRWFMHSCRKHSVGMSGNTGRCAGKLVWLSCACTVLFLPKEGSR